MKRFNELEALLGDMLNRFERKSAARILGYVGAFSSIAQEDDFEAKLRPLEASGAVVVKRARIDGVETIRHLALGDPGPIYAFLRRNPARARADDALRSVRELFAEAPVAMQILDEVEGAWARGVTWSGLTPDDEPILRRALTMVSALERDRRQRVANTDYRTFSRRSVGDSKFLERRTALVVALHRRIHSGNDDQLHLDEAEYLAALGLMRLPQPLLVSGNLLIDGQPVPNLPFIGLPPDHAHRVTVQHHRYVLTIENYVSFLRHSVECNAGKHGLVIYTAGFPARQVLEAILSLAGQASCPVFHWGDMDRGGLRIFVHLENALRSQSKALHPHLMDEFVLAEHGVSSDADVGPVPPKAADSAIASIWEHMHQLDAFRTVEQESLDPSSPGEPARIWPTQLL